MVQDFLHQQYNLIFVPETLLLGDLDPQGEQSYAPQILEVCSYTPNPTVVPVMQDFRVRISGLGFGAVFFSQRSVENYCDAGFGGSDFKLPVGAVFYFKGVLKGFLN